jgi:hypothetical protein
MGYGKYLEPTLSKRFTSRRWTTERLDRRRKQLEQGTKQEEITKTVEEIKEEIK